MQGEKDKEITHHPYCPMLTNQRWSCISPNNNTHLYSTNYHAIQKHCRVHNNYKYSSTHILQIYIHQYIQSQLTCLDKNVIKSLNI